MSHEVSRNDLAFLQYCRALAEQIEREEEAYTAQLQVWLAQAMQATARTITLGVPGTITGTSTNSVPNQISPKRAQRCCATRLKRE